MSQSTVPEKTAAASEAAAAESLGTVVQGAVVEDGLKSDALKSITTFASSCSTFSKQEQLIQANAALASFKKPATWVVVFGAVLAMCAGIVNVVFFLLTGQFVTNHTGHTAKLGMRVEGVQVGEVSHVDLQRTGLILLSFAIGAFLCGMLIDKNQVHFGGKSAYGLALLGNSFLLILATYALPHVGAVYLGAIASGLQNAMCTSHFGAVVRTTHVTGTLTDIGSTTGRMVMILLRKRCAPARLNVLERAEFEVDMKKLSVLLPVYFSFVFGCTIGAYLEQKLQKYALLVPAAITGVAGLVYGCFRQRLKQQFKRMEVNRLGEDLVEVQHALQRAHGTLEQIHHHQRAHNEAQEKGNSENDVKSEGDFADLDDQMAHALELVHDMEFAFEGLQGPRNAAPSPNAVVRLTEDAC